MSCVNTTQSRELNLKYKIQINLIQFNSVCVRLLKTTGHVGVVNTHFKHHLSIIIIKFLQTVIIKIPLIPTKSLWNWK